MPRTILLVTGFLAWASVLAPVASAQDMEPNDTCSTARDGGAIAPPALVAGSLREPDSQGVTDLDFYRFTAAPGLELSARVTFPTRVGLFSESCDFVAAPDPSLDTQLDFTVPASGVFIVAVADNFDELFSGMGLGRSGPYQLSFELQPPKIGSISGRVVDAVTGAPLGGGSPTLARVTLWRCIGGSCFALGAIAAVDASGEFQIEREEGGRRIDVGEFQLVATAPDFESFTTSRFSVAAGQNLDLGDVSLTPLPISITNVRPCMDLPPRGGTCRYTVAVRNRTAARVKGQALSLVRDGRTDFEASTQRSGIQHPVRAPLDIPARSSRDVTFFFSVPSLVPSGTTICTWLQAGVNPSPLFNGQRQFGLFCIVKGGSGLEVMSAAESRAILERMEGTDMAPPQPVR